MANERYTINRNLWKKIYPITRQKPKMQQLVAGAITYSVNLENYQRDRSLFKVQPDYGQYQTAAYVDTSLRWEDGKFFIPSVNSNLEYTFDFVGNFNDIPIVCLGIIADEPSMPSMLNPDSVDILSPFNSPTVAVYGIGSPSKTSVTFRTSAEYTGSIHYFAFDSSIARNVTPNIDYWDTGSYQASGGKITASLTLLDCSTNIAWDSLTAAASPSDVYVAITPYLTTSIGPVIFPSNKVSSSENYGPFYNNPDTIGDDQIYASCNGEMVFHFIAITKEGGSGDGGGFAYSFGFELGT